MLAYHKTLAYRVLGKQPSEVVIGEDNMTETRMTALPQRVVDRIELAEQYLVNATGRLTNFNNATMIELICQLGEIGEDEWRVSHKKKMDPRAAPKRDKAAKADA